MRDQTVFLMARTQSYMYVQLYMFSVLISISGDSSSYFLDMIMLIGSAGNITRTKIMAGKKTYPG